MSTTETAPAAGLPGAKQIPSLNQLASRIDTLNTSTSSSGPDAAVENANNTSAGADKSRPTGGGIAGLKPRLTASVLRTESNASLATAASAADSMAVNPPTTRSTTPNAISTPGPTVLDEPVPIISDAGGNADQGEPLTMKKLEELNKQSSRDAADKKTAWQ